MEVVINILQRSVVTRSPKYASSAIMQVPTEWHSKRLTMACAVAPVKSVGFLRAERELARCVSSTQTTRYTSTPRRSTNDSHLRRRLDRICQPLPGSAAAADDQRLKCRARRSVIRGRKAWEEALAASVPEFGNAMPTEKMSTRFWRVIDYQSAF